jgi:hypothetical protein
MADSHRGRRTALLAAALASLVARTAEACPLCNSETGAAVRASIFGEHFVTTLLAVLSPFPVIVVAVLLLHFGWPRVPQRRGRDGT